MSIAPNPFAPSDAAPIDEPARGWGRLTVQRLAAGFSVLVPTTGGWALAGTPGAVAVGAIALLAWSIATGLAVWARASEVDPAFLAVWGEPNADAWLIARRSTLLDRAQIVIGGVLCAAPFLHLDPPRHALFATGLLLFALWTLITATLGASLDTGAHALATGQFERVVSVLGPWTARFLPVRYADPARLNLAQACLRLGRPTEALRAWRAVRHLHLEAAAVSAASVAAGQGNADPARTLLAAGGLDEVAAAELEACLALHHGPFPSPETIARWIELAPGSQALTLLTAACVAHHDLEGGRRMARDAGWTLDRRDAWTTAAWPALAVLSPDRPA